MGRRHRRLTLLGGGDPLSGRPRFRLAEFAVLVGTAVVVFAVDHLTKWLIVRAIPLGQQRPRTGMVTLHHIHNAGAAFGLFPGAQVVFLVVAVVVSGYILIAGQRLGGWPMQLALGMVLGGAVANAVDRVVQGYVVDFIDLQVWPVFNVADSAIVVGIATAVLLGFRRSSSPGPDAAGARRAG